MKYLLDTDTFSEMVKGLNPGIDQRLRTLHAEDPVLSVVTHGEIIFGASLRALTILARRRMDALLRVIRTLPLPAEAATHYGKLRAHLHREGTPIGPNDLWIAAHALAADLTLVTNNTREFSRVPQLRLENWVKVRN
jgi:tRNA(fMet)-specific endonuclease VapC